LAFTPGPLNKRYAAPTIDESLAQPSPQFIALVNHFVSLREKVLECLNSDSVEAILNLSLEEVLRALYDEPSFWEGLVLGHGGLQQLVLDIKFLLATSQGYVSKNAMAASDSLIRRAVEIYCQITKQSKQANVLPSEQWFLSMIEAALKNLGIKTIGKLFAQQQRTEEEQEKEKKEPRKPVLMSTGATKM